FEFAYDWRQDNVANAHELGELIKRIVKSTPTEPDRPSLPPCPDHKVDIIAHSMGGLIAQYYVAYGDAELPADGAAIAVPTFAGAEYVRRLVLVGTPSRGSHQVLRFFTDGFDEYEHHGFGIGRDLGRAVLATFPSAYQLLPFDGTICST